MPEEPRSVPGDADLLGRLREGDAEAFDDLVRAYQKEIYRLAWRLTGSPAEADDLAQETFLRAWRALPTFRGEASLRTWLTRIATNLALNTVQSARLARRDDVDVEVVAPPTPHAGDAELESEERRRRAEEAIRRLPPRQRTTLVLRIHEGLMFRQIAETMGCTVGTAKANYFHAVAALRRSLKELIG